MKSNKKKIGGGSGGGGCPVVPPPCPNPTPTPTPKPKPKPVKDEDDNDIRHIRGRFMRYASRIGLLSLGNSKETGGVVISAGGHEPAEAKIVSNDQLLLHTGQWAWNGGNSEQGYHGVFIHTDPDNAREVNIMRGTFDDLDNSQWITLDPNGNINISVGPSGSINLGVGSDDNGDPISSISISAQGIAIKGPLVKIN
jgi:hypothetical protein